MFYPLLPGMLSIPVTSLCLKPKLLPIQIDCSKFVRVAELLGLVDIRVPM